MSNEAKTLIERARALPPEVGAGGDRPRGRLSAR